MLMRVLVGLGIIAFGVFLIVKTEWMISAFGRIAWAEDKLGAEGGTRVFYKLLGMTSIVLAFMIMSGKIFTLLDWIFKR